VAVSLSVHTELSAKLARRKMRCEATGGVEWALEGRGGARSDMTDADLQVRNHVIACASSVPTYNSVIACASLGQGKLSPLPPAIVFFPAFVFLRWAPTRAQAGVLLLVHTTYQLVTSAPSQ
jgi:hypothetical protein